MSNPVSAKYFDSTMGSAPTVTGAAGGGLLPLLNYCLSDGFGSVTLYSVVVASGVATATHNTAHGFLDYQVVTISGATPSGLNGDKRITWVSATVFTFDATGISDQTATGTITAKTTAAGWTKGPTGTNKATYYRTASGATAHYLLVDDSAATWSGLKIYRTMSDVDTGTDVVPTSGSGYLYKSSDSGTERAWRMYADAYCFFLWIDANGTNPGGQMFFGDIVSVRPGDAYHCALFCHDNTKTYNRMGMIGGNTEGQWLARAYDQVTVAPTIGKWSNYRSASVGGVGGGVGWAGGGPAAIPNLSDFSLLVSPIEVWESSTIFRGFMPGIYAINHSGALKYSRYWGTVDLAGRWLCVQPYEFNNTSVNAFAMDLTGPWRSA